jgi:hypothetical protein
MPITPDTKNWTWVLERACPECGFDAAKVARNDVVRLLDEKSEQWVGVLQRADVRARPDEETWSPLEYACHVRDVFRVFDGRIALMLAEDDPTYPNWDQDRTVIDDDYAAQDPQQVATELLAAAGALAARFAGVSGPQWSRTGTRGDGSRFTVESLARYMIHDPIHHLYDVRA